jgi:hypothetical protein
MKLIRLTDDRYILDMGPDADARQVEELKAYWEDWWKTEKDFPRVVILGGVAVPLEFEDRRDPAQQRLAAIEKRLDRLEQHWHHAGLFHNTDDPQYPGPELPAAKSPDPGRRVDHV